MTTSRSQWPRGLRHGSVAARYLGSRVRIQWMSFSCECCVLSGFSASGWSPVQRSPTEWDRESSIVRRPWPTGGCCVMIKKIKHDQTVNVWLFNPLQTKRRPLYLKTQSVPRSKHFISVIKNQSVFAVSGTSRCLF